MVGSVVRAGAGYIADAIRAFVARSAPGVVADQIGDDADLIADGLLDSLGFMHLLADLEQQLGRPIDLESMPADRMTVVSALAAHIAEQILPEHGR
jgi:acyl carrier protein